MIEKSTINSKCIQIFVSFLGKRLSKRCAALSRAVLIRANDIKVSWRESQVEVSPIIDPSDWQRKITLPSPPADIRCPQSYLFLPFYSLVSPQNFALQVENWQGVILKRQSYNISLSAVCRLHNPHVFLLLICLLPPLWSEIIHSASCKPNPPTLWLGFHELNRLLAAKLLVL